MYALGPILFVLLLIALGAAGFTGVGVQDSRDTCYTLVPRRKAPLLEGRSRLSDRLNGSRTDLLGKGNLPPIAGHHDAC